ncbi:aminotransferase class I/II-fold pyridoxal phosphate-dependent enzyme [Candidatus Bathyarchaeota archaeon]|nr:aminotransferase class I/II-fold pyridoxal phosphate-dependent enzyme [Candidatus Bathyarchaeota archaeon]
MQLKGVILKLPKEYIALNAGDPDVEAPQYAINEALIGLIEGGKNTHYPHYSGYPTQFQEAVVDYYKEFTGVEYDPKNVISAAGSSAALFIALAAVLEQGDEVLMFTPYYMGHKNIFEGMGVKMNLVPLYRESNYHPDVDEIAEAITPKTKAALICNPSNPTGTVFKEEELKAIGDLAVDNDFAILADEIYLHFVYDDNKFISVAGLGDEIKDRTLCIMSFSKTFSMTGWRLGYDIIPDKYLDRADLFRGMTAPRPATFVYRAGIACLRGDFKYVDERKKEYEKRRNYFTEAVDELGWPCQKFEGAFYAWFDVTSTGMGSGEFLDKLEESQNVRLSPGDRFGADGFIRVPLVQPVPVLEEVVNRLESFKDSL